MTTDGNGRLPELELDTPPLEYSLTPGSNQPYAEYTIQVSADGYETTTVSGTEVLPDSLALQTINLRPLTSDETYDNIVIPAHTLYGDYPPKIAESETKPGFDSGEIVLSRVVIPEFVVVPRRRPH